MLGVLKVLVCLSIPKVIWEKKRKEVVTQLSFSLLKSMYSQWNQQC